MSFWDIFKKKRPPVVPPDSTPVPPTVPVEPSRPLLPGRIVVDGLNFVEVATGKRWTWAMMDGFSDFHLYLTEGEAALREKLKQAKQLGANGRRVFGTMFNIARLDPLDHGERYYEILPVFFDIYRQEGLWLEWVCFCDARLLKGDVTWQLAHYLRVCEIIRAYAPHVFLELVNENDSNDNGVDTKKFPKPEGITACIGSNGAGSNPPGPNWDYANLHCERRGDRPAVTTTTIWFAIHGYSEGTDSYRGTGIATINDEPQGFRETPDGRRVTDPEIAYLMGIGCGYGAGGTAHADSAILSQLLGPNEAKCVEFFIKGVKAACNGREV